MPPTHALELPEIIREVAKYAPRNSLPACIRVSKNWYKEFIPFIWKDVQTDDHKPNALEFIHGHQHLIRTIDISTYPTAEVLALRCPNLWSLSLHCFANNHQRASEILPPLCAMIAEHPFITHLTLYSMETIPSSSIWEVISKHLRLVSLSIRRMVIRPGDAKNLWHLCTQLEDLHIYETRFPAALDVPPIPSEPFTRIKTLTLLGLRSEKLQLAIIDHCPGLQSFRWSSLGYMLDKRFVSAFVQKLLMGTWPQLENVAISTSFMTNEHLANILSGIQQIRSLKLTYGGAFEHTTLQLLQRHFMHLKVLELRSLSRFVGPLLQEILASCPLLEVLRAPWIQAIDIVKGKPWVCCGKLKVLDMTFLFESSTVDQLQPLVLDQLSKLTRLEVLKVGIVGTIDNNQDSKEPIHYTTLDLRLDKGLGKLSNLRALREMDFSNTVQCMNHQEIDWILEHWRSLVRISGTMNYQERKIDMELRERLKDLMPQRLFHAAP